MPSNGCSGTNRPSPASAPLPVGGDPHVSGRLESRFRSCRMLFNRLPALAAALLSSLVLSRAAGAQPAGGAADPRLDKLEDRLFMHSYAYEDAGSRLDRLEQMVFGQKMSGSPPGRIARLTAAVPGWDDKDGVGRRAAASQVSDPPPPVLRPPLPGPLANSPAGASGAGQTDPSPPGTGQSGPALRPFMAGGGAGSGDGGVFVRRRRSAGPTAIAETADRRPPKRVRRRATASGARQPAAGLRHAFSRAPGRPPAPAADRPRGQDFRRKLRRAAARISDQSPRAGSFPQGVRRGRRFAARADRPAGGRLPCPEPLTGAQAPVMPAARRDHALARVQSLPGRRICRASSGG